MRKEGGEDPSAVGAVGLGHRAATFDRGADLLLTEHTQRRGLDGAVERNHPFVLDQAEAAAGQRLALQHGGARLPLAVGVDARLVVLERERRIVRGLGGASRAPCHGDGADRRGAMAQVLPFRADAIP
ncbi:MAG: hypothetical protein ACQETV_02175 [Actinomycetota bacterium]